MTAAQPSTIDAWFAACCIVEPDARLTVDEIGESLARWADDTATARPAIWLAVQRVLAEIGVAKDADMGGVNRVIGVRLRRAGE